MAAATVSPPSRCGPGPWPFRGAPDRAWPLQTAAPVADLSATRTVGTQAVGDVGALIWVAEQLDLIGHIDRACGNLGAKKRPVDRRVGGGSSHQRRARPDPSGIWRNF